MKTFITAAILSTTLMTSSAMAMGLGFNISQITRDLDFPAPTSETVTQDQTKPGK